MANLAPQATATAAGVCNYDQTAAKEAELLNAGWKKTFEDNFDASPASSLNPNWNVWVGGAFNNELEMFTANERNLYVAPDPDNTANNVLVIKAIKESVTGPKYRQDVDATPTNFEFTSARIESKAMYAPNKTNSQVRFVSRIKLPSGYGMWPAFWLYGDNWPTNGEIDILEARGNEPFLFQSNYFFGRQANNNLVQNAATYITTNTSLTDCWHVYELVWTKQSLTFLLDGQVVDVKTGGYVPDLYAKLERITLNQAVGGDFFYKDSAIPTPSQIPLNEGEGVMLVDWVKVYVKK
ncbi:glycoside hydrolase family 16 protein [Hymenobacter sp. BT770]|uniref:glycoside hydrolase family 16 protein n=1 Tax=Hymenobacter sp. BT770 TaxID=2886942 RepID=UPI001D106F57|nr:glycoside hydrolase family 16 protein [Hymenobacter sp. BT770]MCC3152801.1 glycoside hydrolase family 16 protein [Hymenobacter sp. BT770]MDO3414876.1 glycoside hydrolase family 16 protein [Hymenobacter sp. BT770]